MIIWESGIIGRYQEKIIMVNLFDTNSLGSFIYNPKEEFGYIKNRKREYSICFNIEFNEKSIKHYKPYYYILDKDCVPQAVSNPTQKEIFYFNQLNKNIENQFLYKRKKYTSLLVREVYSLILRFKINPKAAISHYSVYIKNKIQKA